MARPPTPPGMPTPTPTPRPCAPMPTGVSPADYFQTCSDDFSNAVKNETSLAPDDVLAWIAEVLAAFRAAEL